MTGEPTNGRQAMPHVTITTAGPALSDAQKTALFTETTALLRDVMNKNADLTSIRIDEFPAGNWAIGAETVPAAAQVDIKITAGTNKEPEKAEMIRRVMEMLRRILGELPEASYIIIHELDAQSWGYDGKTQHDRAASRAA